MQLKRSDERNRVWSVWVGSGGRRGWKSSDGVYEWIISTSGSGHDDEIAWAISKDGMEVGTVVAFQAACAWIARRIAGG